MSAHAHRFLNKRTVFILALIAIWTALSFHVEPNLEHLAEDAHKLTSFAGWDIPMGGVNIDTVVMTWWVMGFLMLIALVVSRPAPRYPGRFRTAIEAVVDGFDQLCQDTLGPRGRTYVPFIGTLFLFILCSNWIAVLPIPGVHEPTKDLNTTLGLGFLCFLVAHGSAIKHRGVLGYLEEYFSPMLPIAGRQVPNLIMFPLNVIGELGKVVSHSLRLFGNIMGGAVILGVVGELTKTRIFLISGLHSGLMLVLNLFLGLFVGLVQSFVFAMLALTYTAVLVMEE